MCAFSARKTTTKNNKIRNNQIQKKEKKNKDETMVHTNGFNAHRKYQVCLFCTYTKFPWCICRIVECEQKNKWTTKTTKDKFKQNEAKHKSKKKFHQFDPFQEIGIKMIAIAAD